MKRERRINTFNLTKEINESFKLIENSISIDNYDDIFREFWGSVLEVDLSDYTGGNKVESDDLLNSALHILIQSTRNYPTPKRVMKLVNIVKKIQNLDPKREREILDVIMKRELSKVLSPPDGVSISERILADIDYNKILNKGDVSIKESDLELLLEVKCKIKSIVEYSFRDMTPDSILSEIKIKYTPSMMPSLFIRVKEEEIKPRLMKLIHNVNSGDNIYIEATSFILSILDDKVSSKRKTDFHRILSEINDCLTKRMNQIKEDVVREIGEEFNS